MLSSACSLKGEQALSGQIEVRALAGRENLL